MFDDQNLDYIVLKNTEEQYSLWPADRTPPDGWETAGFKGNKAECLAFIETNWTDMRPLSLRTGVNQ